MAMAGDSSDKTSFPKARDEIQGVPEHSNQLGMANFKVGFSLPAKERPTMEAETPGGCSCIPKTQTQLCRRQQWRPRSRRRTTHQTPQTGERQYLNTEGGQQQ